MSAAVPPKIDASPRQSASRPGSGVAGVDAPLHPARDTMVQVQIDRLALDGFRLEPGQERRVRASLNTELGRLLTEGPLPDRLQAGGAVPYLPGGPLHIASWKDPADLGRQIALALYRGLNR